MGQDTNADELLQTLGREIIKVHREYDGSNRLQYNYEALANAANGGPAIKTTYTYDGASERVVGMKEELATWNSAWDI
jgi:hypothetical protein